jgi:CHASE2 domain-containing sensor protein
VLRKEISPDRIANKIVAFGSAAKGIDDAAPSRLYSNLNGVEIHVQAIEGMILEKLLNRPGYFQVVELLYYSWLDWF